MEKYLLLTVAILSLNMTETNAVVPLKRVVLPFYNEPIITPRHIAGLTFQYDMTGIPGKKVICQLSQLYKAFLQFPVSGNNINSDTYGQDKTVVLTSADRKKTVDKSADEYRIDPKGYVNIYALPQNYYPQPMASCFYEATVKD